MANGVSVSDVSRRTEVTVRGPLAASHSSPTMSFARATWERWKNIAHAIGVVQTRILMIVFFFLVVFPLGLVMRLTGDPLHLKVPKGSNWTPVRDEEQNLSAARRQF